jgi:hypothetical protein
MWLQEDILKRYVPPKGLRGATAAGRKRPGKQVEAEATATTAAAAVAEEDTKAPAEGISVEEVLRWVQQGRRQDEAAAVEAAVQGEVLQNEAGEELHTGPVGSLFTISTIDAYVATVIELYDRQLSLGLARPPHPRSAVLKALLKTRRRERDKNERESFQDRGDGSVSPVYTDANFIDIHRGLVRETVNVP